MWLALLSGILSGWLAATGIIRLLLSGRFEARLFWSALGATLIVFVVYAFWEKRHYEIPTVVFLLVVTTASLFAKRWNFGGRWQVALAIIFCGYTAAAVYYLGEERKTDDQQRFANSYLASRDELGEFLLNEVNGKIQNDPFIVSVWNNPLRNRSIIKEKIKRVYLQNYFDQYDVTIRLFESSGENLEVTTDPDLASFLLNHKKQALTTGYEGVFIRHAPDLPSARNYRVITRIGRGSLLAGFIVVDLNLKRAIPESVFPEVLLDEKRIQFGQSGPYSYAWWTNDQILNSFGSFEYTQLDLTEATPKDRFIQLGYVHRVIGEEQGRWLVVSRPAYTLLNGLANFSFFFLLWGAAFGAATFIRQRHAVLQWRDRSFAQRLQIITLVSAALPFFVMAVMLFQLIRAQNREQLNGQFIQRARNLSEVLSSQLQPSEGEEMFSQLRRLTDLDFSVFDKNGMLITTNQPAVYDQHVLSRLLSPNVLASVQTQSPLVRDEQIGRLGYRTCYLPVRSNLGEMQAILAVPFFDFDRSNERSEIRTINLLLILFVAIGIFAVLLSMRLTRQLVSPLQWMAQTLGQTTFQQSPTLLTWKRKDEWGALVDAYNRMLSNWTEAKVRLSKQEKESAWREMARQVAHEIKNPLTPMKLTLQQMQLLRSRQGLTDQRVDDSIGSLLHQVDLLNEIATSFASFAGMPTPKLEKIEVGEVLARVVGLYHDPAQGQVDIQNEAGPCVVLVDDQILSRAFSNILLNAWQSADRPVQVLVRVVRSEGLVRIVFTDNGPGIPEELLSKIFVPSFTTKKGGSGLGLAISKQGIELCKGTIRFTSTFGVGATFEIELPVLEAEA
jgi:signal transduction histidine kinase